MEPAIFSGGHGFINISLVEADTEAVRLGACDVADYMAPIRSFSYSEGVGTRREPMFRYYFLVDGTELGYFTYPLGSMLIHGKPRIWGAGFRADLMKDRFFTISAWEEEQDGITIARLDDGKLDEEMDSCGS
jgi:hypothetical protein